MFNFVRQLWWFIKKNWYHYILILIVGIFSTIVLLLPAQILGDICNKISLNEIITTNYLIFEVGLKYFFYIILIYVVFTIKRVLQNRLKIKLYYALQVKYMEKIIVQDATFFEHFQSGDLLTRALGDVKSVNFSGGNRLLNIFLETTSIVVTLIAMLMINKSLTLYSVLPLPIIFFANLFLRKKVKKNWKNVRTASSNMGNVVLESITNVRTIRAFSKEEENYQKNLEYSQKVYDIEKKNLKINVVFQPIFQSVTAVATLIAYFIGSDMIIHHTDNFLVGDLTKFIVYLNMLAAPLTSIGNMLNNFYQSLISLDRLNDIYNAKSLVVDVDNAKELKEVDDIEFKHIYFKYDGDIDYVLKDINLEIKKGETLGIVGKTGSGKSTLVRQLIRQFPLTKGELLINGQSVNDIQKESIRKMVGYVPQEHMLFSRSVYKNVALGSVYDIDSKKIDDVITMADFKKDIENLPDGLDTMVGEYGVTLSGGQKQRLSIARAFMKDADILILDDSLSAVDGKTEANIISNLKKYRHNKTNVIVSHRLSAVMHADNIIVLDNGRIVESGTHAELMASGGWYAKLFVEQQMQEKEGEKDE